jgi:general L-amino acid transport system permease protein
MQQIIKWSRKNFFATRMNTLLSLVSLWLIYVTIEGVVSWAFINASFLGADKSSCMARPHGACWPFVTAKFNQFIYGNYPAAEQWRVNIVFLLGALGLGLLMAGRINFKKQLAVLMLTAYPVLTFILLSGGLLGLSYVETNQWGGLLVTLVIAVTGIVVSLPLGILLALGRRSELPIIRMMSIAFIEFWRGVPLITVLFMASVMLPLFLPEGMNFDALLRCLIGVSLFASAYMAEVIRGGLQAIPKGQYEAGKSIGLSYWKSMRLIILPQALVISIPGIVNTFIGLFKDTTLVMIVGIFDLLGIISFHFTDPNWTSPQVPITGFVFAGLVFWVFCFAMSHYSKSVERRFSVKGENK